MREWFARLDWRGMVRAALKAVWPFLAGSVGGILTGCSVTGSGLGLTL